ncbi:Secreted protein OS=Streptomyces alboniger OX=132473 GN=CP975_19715 PE=4 SV=1 [Streptomyces alboniger]
MFAEPVVLRGLVAAAAAAAVVGSVVMRRWDQAAGKQVAELGRARASDEWRHEERMAEAEADLEESRELRGRLETKLRAKRAELAALRNEHAELLRRYATAETERASALEGRRLLAIEAGSTAPALPKAGAEDLVPGAVDLVPAVRAGAPAPAARTENAAPPKGSPAPRTEAARPRAAPALSLFQRANAALDRMTPRAEPTAPPQAEDESRGKPGAADGYGGHERAVAVAPPVQARRPAPQGGFDFFGNKSVAPGALEAVQNEDLADVVGEEALAVHKAEAEAEFKAAPAADSDAARGVGQVIDLTAHDETEQIDVAGLRTALRA